MAILANPNYFEREQAGDTEQVLVAVRYVGGSRRAPSSGPVNQGLFPAEVNFLNGVWHVGFVPESPPEGSPGVGVTWFERREAWEVEYDPAAIARILLDRNYLSLEPGGVIGDDDTVPGYDAKLRAALGLEPAHEAGATLEEQLKELAGVDEATAEEEVLPDEERLVAEYDRTELKEAVKSVREDASEFSLRGASTAAMAAFLVEQTDDSDAAIREAN